MKTTSIKPGTPAYDAIEKIIADLFKEINNGKPVDDSNIKQVAMKYLTEKVGLTQEQIAQLQEKLDRNTLSYFQQALINEGLVFSD